MPKITYESFPFGEALALLVESCVFGVIFLFELLERFAGGPVIEGQVSLWMIAVA